MSLVAMNTENYVIGGPKLAPIGIMGPYRNQSYRKPSYRDQFWATDGTYICGLHNPQRQLDSSHQNHHHFGDLIHHVQRHPETPCQISFEVEDH
jgi:hypothetical protein